MKKLSDIFAYPTESFYALGADATEARTIRQLFRVKHREPGKPIALIAGDLHQVRKYFYLSPAELKVAKKYWPGAVTILLRPKKAIAAAALLGTTQSRHSARQPSYDRRVGNRIGVRVPAHAQARKLALKVGAPITATSANISGQPPTKSAAKVKRVFPGILVVPGKCGRAKKPSTVVEIMNHKIKIIRKGAVNPVRSFPEKVQKIATIEVPINNNF